ncbi:MAG: peptide-methionine (S)-S-oxide reductase MsrA [Cyanobacteria bacterium SZAS-4]|nr:peptide-methionine (S)-S-oxide reductase MsrA [Cyanobacteria bacterium SZAS-4]
MAAASLVVVGSFSTGQAAQTAEKTAASAEKSPTSATGVKLERALFAEGCFWKVQSTFSKVPGVVKTTVGYTGGKVPNPSYHQVCTDTTGHAETCLVEFDPTKTTYHKLLETFFASHDPTTKNSQGPDFGTQYRSVIFYSTPQQEREALQMKEQLTKEHKFFSPIVTEIVPAKPFYSAEEYHQNYFEKHGMVCH